MARVPRVVVSALVAAAVGLAARPAAGTLTTTIDLDYTYSQENVNEDVDATTQYNQKFEIKYETSLTSTFDFTGAATLDLQDVWYTDEAGSSRVAPTLELEVSGDLSSLNIAYDGVVSTTDAFQESGETTTYSTSLSVQFEATPRVWPETKVKFQRRHDYQPWKNDSTNETVELTLKKDYQSLLRLEFNLQQENTDRVLPEAFEKNSIEWSGKATLKEELWGGTEFEMAYEVKESYSEDLTQGVFSNASESYSQQFKTRLKNSLSITPRMKVGLSWEYQYDQDLLALDLDYKLSNKFKLDLRWDLVEWFKVTGEATRETKSEFAPVGDDFELLLTDTVKAGVDVTPFKWLRLSAKTQYRSENEREMDTGGTVDEGQEWKHEITAKNRFGDFWDLTVGATTTSVYGYGYLWERETKFKSELVLKLLGLSVVPTYEATRTSFYYPGYDGPLSPSLTRDGKLKVEYKQQLLDLLAATFSHEYGIKVEDELDGVLNFERTVQLTEDTRLNVAITDLIRDLTLEGEVERKASDTEEDTDPQLVEVSYSLKMEWALDELKLSSTFKYNDKGDTYDDLSFNAKLSWTSEKLEMSGEYQFDKIYAELKDEKRKLNLRLNYKF